MSKLNDSILAIGRCSTQFRGEKMAEHGLKSCHTSYLTHICAQPGVSQDKLAQLIYINKSNVARQAAILEELGYITRQPSATDKRVMELYPTQKALVLLPQIQSIVREWDEKIMVDLSQDEVDTVLKILQRMQDKAAAWLNEH